MSKARPEMGPSEEAEGIANSMEALVEGTSVAVTAGVAADTTRKRFFIV